ncbi:MAG: hypothetical protein Q9187_005720 [Circinaria calcarea]
MKLGHPSILLVEQFRSLVNAPGTSQENRLMAQKLAEFNFNQYGLRSPSVIVDATSHAEKDPNSSAFNYITASITLDLLEKLVSLDGVKAENIAILTRYTAQIRVYRCVLLELRKTNPALLIEDVQITTIDSIQGGEADIPLLDLCVSNQIGFLKYLNRVNVATSRTRDAIYIMIDIKDLYHGARPKDRKWVTEVITYFRNRSLVHHVPDEYPRNVYAADLFSHQDEAEEDSEDDQKDEAPPTSTAGDAVPPSNGRRLPVFKWYGCR